MPEVICYWCSFVQGKPRDESEIKGKVYVRDIRKVDDGFALFYQGSFNFHRECLVLQIKKELELETNQFNRNKKRLLKEIEDIESDGKSMQADV